jgi:hypothetical protein
MGWAAFLRRTAATGALQACPSAVPAEPSLTSGQEGIAQAGVPQGTSGNLRTGRDAALRRLQGAV